jgi:crotonobetainyl-CoA:carnitine CoA-transferase CaiB-like acyl-CoA transferase
MEGVKVVELGVWVAGPAAGCILGDWGADIVKIEPPGIGDPSRLFDKMLGADMPFNPIFENDNRNKRSVVLDLRKPEGLALAYELIDAADVFVSNVRTGSLARLGLDWETLRARNPRLVYASITGYGLEGPDADRAAYDVAAFWSRAGIAGSLMLPGQPPPFQRGGMGDHNTGLAAAGAVCAALYERERTGEGQLVSTSLLREGMYTLSFDMAVSLRFGVDLLPGNRKTMGNPAMNNYQDSEGKWFWIVGLEGARHWPALARAAGHPEWLDDPRFKGDAERALNAEALIEMLDEIFATRTRAEWGEVFDAEENLWWAPVQTMQEVLQDPQAHAAGGFVEVPDGEGTTLLPATPVDFGGKPCAQRNMAPDHGADGDAILAELGRDPEAIEALRKAGVVGGPSRRV